MPSTLRQPVELNVLFATPECAPLVKTGGLGDVSGALPAALREIGVDARILMPAYPAVLAANPRAPELGRLTVLGQEVRLLDARLPDGGPLIALACPPLFERGGGPYQADDGEDWEDNALRFGVLSRVAALLAGPASPLDWRPDVLHCNDWPTALAPAYLHYAGGPRARTVVTIHNLAFQGTFPTWKVRDLELPPQALGIEGLEFYGRVSFLKGGLMFSDAITTVSPTYAEEIQRPELGFGLDGVLRRRRGALFGVLNGIDTKVWNPKTDPWIPARYGPLSLDRKAENKVALKQRMGLAGPDEVPLMVMVSRLTHQKGIDVLLESVAALAGIPAQLAVVGTGDRDLIEKLRAVQARMPEKVGVFIGFDEALAHLAEAGGDMFLMPSRFEPCGMNQMYSQRYGTPPLANATGGLVDTIVDAARLEGAARPTGFLMPEATPGALVETARRAVAAYGDPRHHWRTLQLNGMARDFGWASAAREHLRIYKQPPRTPGTEP